MSTTRYLISVLLAGVCALVVAEDLPNPDEHNLANIHLKDETCAGQCHLDEEPSDDLEFEYNSCVECHDDFGHLEGRQHNLKHKESEEMECVECHLPHEEFDPKDTCTDCHDEEDEELSDFYSVRLERYLNTFSLDVRP
ncbi:Cytochrome c3-like protein [Vibrio crassostreae]|uniref:cytochrome c3 family protein n=1 Tax=Vibrio crassostreae TaxID=246167 RepID=UPI000F493022|nr:cytochrome c3 family protein [Vibrio crassostreae]ROR18925.1 cytochrome c3-like protein [Vibrio crassostreae]CAK1816496.1 Cytochrome c3-like protein [Vibrio crassostreae]CAK2299181.1 Cytochrome c3-like protein [Vibrio crassostreae]CAK2302860.1 Cytochrome c3-like protein [Vibrio crassostreae]CAK3212250.1 Cytochrome c3-like protein [Vibrio crassostreae]